MITLGVGKFEIDWGKNNYFASHSALFLPSDVRDVPYYYADGIVEYKEGLSRKLKDVKRRLELLGYPLHLLKPLYEAHVASICERDSDAAMSFDELYRVLYNLDLHRIALEEGTTDLDKGRFVSEYLFRLPEFNKEIDASSLVPDRWAGEIFETLDSHIILRILSENPDNSELDLQWRYADVVEGGWVDKDEIFEGLSDFQRILIVTEGSSDSFVIQRALELLGPDIADFFRFVDMQEHYPFTGTGNLYRFCQGLASIGILNKVLIMYDNDVAGVNNYNLCKQLSLPDNMHIARLPDCEAFESFQTVGPNGERRENINGLAVSIECFLDLSYNMESEPCVRWTSYDKTTGKYQGELVNKDSYVRQFKQIRSAEGEYDWGKLRYLTDNLYYQWVARGS